MVVVTLSTVLGHSLVIQSSPIPEVRCLTFVHRFQGTPWTVDIH